MLLDDRAVGLRLNMLDRGCGTMSPAGRNTRGSEDPAGRNTRGLKIQPANRLSVGLAVGRGRDGVAAGCPAARPAVKPWSNLPCPPTPRTTWLTASVLKASSFSGSRPLRSSKNMPPRPRVSPRWAILKYSSHLWGLGVWGGWSVRCGGWPPKGRWAACWRSKAGPGILASKR